jgi:TolA-binding protein
MNVMTCEQSALVEAWQDGRLGVQERASLERHFTSCSACTEQRRLLGTIRDSIREPIPEATPLAHQRARGALLRRAADLGANAHLDRGMRGRLATFAVAAAFVFIALGVGWSWGRSSAPVATVSARPAVATMETSIVPANDARFERARSGGLDTVTLSSGTLAISAGAPKSGERFLVKTEDAELESKDSAFRVDADNGKIRSVVVERGMVDVRYAGFVAVIPAGGSWHASDAKTASLTEAPAPAPQATSGGAAPDSAQHDAAHDATTPAPPKSSASVAFAEPARPSARAGNAPHEATAVAVLPSASTQATVLPPPAPRNDFSNAMRALERGEYDAAANTLTEFATAHPNDARADDAEYMRAIALQRAGRTDDAIAAARAYLAKWPQGSHRREAASIAR